jgi:GGDEF domain-containing protein
MSDDTFLTPDSLRERCVPAGDPPPVIPASDRRQYDALFDPGTRLPKRALLLDRIGVAIVRARRVHRQVALLVLRNIRPRPATARVDTRDIAQALQCRLRHDDTVARLGESTVVVVCNTIDADDDVELIVRRILETMGTVCRVGVTLSGQQENAEHLLADALAGLS